MDNSELYHYGVLGMKWGVRRKQTNIGNNTTLKRPRPVKKPLTNGQKIAIGAAATAAVLATAYGGYTIAKAYGRQSSKAKELAKTVAKGIATASKIEQEVFGSPAFDKGKYDRVYKEQIAKGMKRVLKMPIKDVLNNETSRQRDLIRSTATSIRKRVSPSMFDVFGPEPFSKIWERYNM